MPYIRTTKPTKKDKYYIGQSTGGYSTCVKGKPTDKDCDRLANCVGCANGFLNEYVGLGYEKYHLNCNAENFIERAIASGLSVVKKPVVGGILVWQKGATLKASDGAGHVAGCTWVDDVNNPTKIKTSESAYGGSSFYTSTRTNKNGQWGAGSGYKYRGCIVPPNYVAPTVEPTSEVNPKPTPTSVNQKFNIGDKVIISGKLYSSSNATKATSSVSNKITTITRYAAGAKHPYNTKGDLGWMDESSIKKYTETTTSVPKQKTHTVKAGENLGTIAKKYGTTWQKIYEANRKIIGKNPNIIRAGQVLVIK